MDNNDIDEDSIDTETLQAQIDLSMAFAQNLVSSWMKPSRKLPGRSNRDMEAELKEYMRRPPRLGVGAPIPETQNLSRETARLKGQLIGKGSKRPREGEDHVIKEKSDDEEESRAGAIKKKARVDPFGDGNGKKKKKNKKVIDEASITALPLSITEAAEAEKFEQEEVIGMIVEGDVEEDAFLASSTPHPKKRKRKSSVGESIVVNGVVAEPLPAFSNERLEDTTPAQDEQVKPVTPASLRVVDISLVETPIISSRFQRSSQSADLLKQPLLNLGHHSDDDDDDPSKVESLVNGGSPKRKRKRRKKKKSAQATVTDGPSGAVAQAPP